MDNLTTFASLAAMFFYALGFISLWRYIMSAPAGEALEPISAIANDIGSGSEDNNFFRWLTAVALFGHIVACINVVIGDSGLSLSLIGVSNLVAIVMVSIVAVSSMTQPVSNIFLLLFPISIFNLLCLNLVNSGKTTPIDLNATQAVHILLSISAYAALMTAALQSILLALQESRLKRPGKSLYALLPALETMEHLLLTLLWVGLGLLSLSIITGFTFLEDMFDQRLVHHTVLTSLSWSVYAGFLIGHYFFGWRGVTAVRWNLAAFALLVLGYFGSKFVLEYLL